MKEIRIELRLTLKENEMLIVVDYDNGTFGLLGTASHRGEDDPEVVVICNRLQLAELHSNISKLLFKEGDTNEQSEPITDLEH